MFRIISLVSLLICSETIQTCKVPKVRSIKSNAGVPNQVFRKDSASLGSQILLPWWRCHHFKKNANFNNINKDRLLQKIKSLHNDGLKITEAEKRKKGWNSMVDELLWPESFKLKVPTRAVPQTTTPAATTRKGNLESTATELEISNDSEYLQLSDVHTQKENNASVPYLLYENVRDLNADQQ